MNAGNIRVTERRQHLRLALQPRHSVRVERESSRDHFERNVPTEVEVVRAINLAHAATAQQGAHTQVSSEHYAFMEVARGAAIQQPVTFCVAREHSLNFSDQARITVTGLIDKARTLGGRKLDGGLENLADLAKFVRTQNADRLQMVHRK
jgi:hypothetical protein